MPPPRDIPSQYSSISSLPPQDSPQLFVSSPDSLNSASPWHASEFQGDAEASSSRDPPPSVFGDSHAPISRRPPTLRNAHSWTSRSDRGHDNRNPERPWTLFGQLMQNEGHLTPDSSVARLPSRSSVHETRTLASAASSIAPRGRSLYDQHEELTIGSPSPVRRMEDVLEDHPPPRTPSRSRFQVFKEYCSFIVDKLSLSLVWRNVLKCSIAYFLASLFTFAPALSAIISGMNLSGPSASGHLVATM